MNHSKEKIRVVEELHKPIRKKFKRRSTIIRGLRDLFQADLAQLDLYARFNKNFKYALIVIDCFSKYVWFRPLKTKNAAEVVKAFESILKEASSAPSNLQTDQGSEFFNSKFKLLMKKYEINHYNTFNYTKASIAERVIRTLKERLFKYFSLNGSYKWLDALTKIVMEYNRTKHSTINMKPADVSKDNERIVLGRLNNLKKLPYSQRKFALNDFVRISKAKHIFSKGYTPNWTTELFKIDKIKNTRPVTYSLKDLEGSPISGSFYNEELQKTYEPDVYLVEKVLKKRGNKIFVRWLGFSKSHDSWIDKANVI